jgi:hypothetical protein
VPFDIAFSLPTDDRQLFVVALGTLDGQHYDWSSGRWHDGTAHSYRRRILTPRASPRRIDAHLPRIRPTVAIHLNSERDLRYRKFKARRRSTPGVKLDSIFRARTRRVSRAHCQTFYPPRIWPGDPLGPFPYGGRPRYSSVHSAPARRRCLPLHALGTACPQLTDRTSRSAPFIHTGYRANRAPLRQPGRRFRLLARYPVEVRWRLRMLLSLMAPRPARYGTIGRRSPHFWGARLRPPGVLPFVQHPLADLTSVRTLPHRSNRARPVQGQPPRPKTTLPLRLANMRPKFTSTGMRWASGCFIIWSKHSPDHRPPQISS